MSVFEINSDEVTFFEIELNNILKALRRIECIEIDGEILNELESYKKDVVENKMVDNEKYISIVRIALVALKKHMDSDVVCKLILDFSRISSSIRAVYEEMGLFERLMGFVFKVDYFGTEYNQVLLQDYKYSAYYYKAINVLKRDGFDTFVKFLKEDKFLSNSEDGCWIIMSIFSNLVNGKAFSKTELECLVKEFDESLTKRVRKELLAM